MKTHLSWYKQYSIKEGIQPISNLLSLCNLCINFQFYLSYLILQVKVFTMECPVCFEIFKNPLLLPGCGHTVCQACAELLVTEGNFLRCPECRLIYQLRRGVKSLPKNVALQRTIDEHQKTTTSLSSMCETHPDDAVSLYCKTCEKGICLKCYFPNTLRKGDMLHAGHQVDTSEDVFSRERVCWLKPSVLMCTYVPHFF